MQTQDALRRLRAGDPAGAMAMMAVRPGSDAAQAHVARGIGYLVRSEAVPAMLEFRAALAAGDGAPSTLLNLALAQDGAGETQEARSLMRRVAAADPGWDEPYLRLAESYRRREDWVAAEGAYQTALDRAPGRMECLVGLGALLVRRGAGEEAQLLLLRACGQDRSNAEAWDALGLALRLTGDLRAAEAAFAEARRLAPGRFEFALHGYDAAVANDSVAAELARVELELNADPANPVVHALRGLLLEQTGDRGAAIDALEVAVALSPDAAAPLGLLGGLLARGLRLPEAERMLRRALAADPENPRICNDLAAVLMRLHRPAEARELLDGLLRRIPPASGVLCNLATTTCSQGHAREAVDVARRAVELEPDALLPHRTLCSVMPYADGTSGADLLAALRACGERIKHGNAVERFSKADVLRDPRPGRKLRVGLLSGSLLAHPVGWLTVAGFEALDPSQFELLCFAQNAATDPVARRFRAIAAEWHDIDALGDAEAAALVRARRVDVLIDLGGYGDLGRLPIAARRAAPVQVKWVGAQFHSTGLTEMDWFITDRWETPAELGGLYSENLLVMPDGYVCYSPPADAPDVVALPALESGQMTFGCFNNLAKITPRVIATWAEILRRAPGSRLMLKTQAFGHAATCDEMRRNFVALGIEPTRLVLRGPSSHRAFLAEYNRVDLVLDPFPYSGGLTTCEALWMGVPTITMAGEIFASRHSLSHLSNVGLQDFVAADLDDYVALALRKAADLPALAALRAGLRARVKASPLCDAPRFGRSLGSALRRTWREVCAQAA